MVTLRAMIRQILIEEIDLLDVFECEDGYFAECFKRQDRDIFVVYEGDALAGYCLLNYQPRYSLYKRLDIPEIQDVYVLDKYRQKGLATKLITHCEDLSKKAGKQHIAVSVALHKEAGAAQRLYFKLGYQPDGYGVTYDRQPVDPIKVYQIDDDLCLMMIKDL
ncbi:MAG: GNAT family N-acetyltransferase [Micavibrio sp.]|nr:GNAT family N-acetyltransferase [Micavibrio sp.]